jgi:glycosyltransferase involved in cell wall biosynthesis
MNILFLSRYIDSGGITRVILDSARYLSDKNCNVYLIYGRYLGENNSFKNELLENGSLTLIQIPSLALDLVSIFTIPFDFFKLLYFVFANKINIIHVHWLSLSIIAKVVSIVTRVPYVTTVHLANKKTPRFFRFFSDNNVVISSELEQWLLENEKVAPSKIIKIFNSVKSTDFPPISYEDRLINKKRKGLGDKLVLACLARFSKVKRIDVLLEAITMLKDKNIVLFLCGEGPLEPEIRLLLKNNNIADKVHLMGHVDSRDILSYSDIILLTSDQEGFPMSIIEGMMSGAVPIRTNSEGAIDQIDHGVDGFIVRKGDSETIAKYITEFHNGNLDIKEFSKRAMLKASQTFDFNINQNLILNIYKKEKYDWLQ